MGLRDKSSGSSPQFGIDVAPAGENGVQLNVHGELDLSTSPELSEALEREILAGRSVVVDLSAVTFIDSTGLNALIRGLRAFEANGGSFAVNPNLPHQVRRVFEITGLGSVLPISAR